jgi:hypothetical protein
MANETPFLRKQAWDYFTTHAAQRMTVFNFYIALSTLTAATYFSSFKADSNLATARPGLAFMLCIFAFVFWKLDQRNRFLIKNAERALKHFESTDQEDDAAKIFTREELETSGRKVSGWRRVLIWRLHLSYSDCFNFIFLVFFVIGLVGCVQFVLHLLSAIMHCH